MKNERILDSGEVYREPENDIFEEFEELELDAQKLEKVSWEPLNEGKFPHKTHQIVSDKNELKFVWTRAAKILIIKRVLISCFFLIVGVVIIPLLFLGFGYFWLALMDTMLLYPSRKFNKSASLYWTSYSTFLYKLKQKKGTAINLKDINAIQVIEKSNEGDKFSAYEINLVLNNYERINVIDHGDRSAALEDGQQLANFLGVPFLNNMN